MAQGNMENIGAQSYTMEKSNLEAVIRAMHTDVEINIAVPPESIEESYSANFEQTTMQGRSTPIIGYGNGGPRQVSFALTIREDLISDSGKDIIDITNEFKSLSYPEYELNKINPPLTYVKIGDFISCTGVCDSVSISWDRPYGLTTKGRTAYLQAEVSLSFTEVRIIPQSSSEVASGKSSNTS